SWLHCRSPTSTCATRSATPILTIPSPFTSPQGTWVVGSVVVVVVHPRIVVCTQPASTSHVSVVHGLLSLQVKVRQLALQGWQGPFPMPLSQVSGYSTWPLPHAGHGTRQPAGWLGPVQTGRTCTSPGTRGGAKAPGLGAGAPAGSVTKFRLVGSAPVVAMSAPASTRSAVRATSVLRARASPRVSRRPVGPTWTVQPVSVAAAAPGVAVPPAWAWPLRVASPGKPNPPASRKIVPPLPPPCPPSASSVAAPPTERARSASMSIMPPAFGPAADTSTGPFAAMARPLATQSDPPSFAARRDVAAA